MKALTFLLSMLISGLAVVITSYMLPGVNVKSFFTAVLVAVVLALLNATVKPLLVVLTIPVTVLTLGLFLLVINALIILLADAIVPGFAVANFWWALLFSLILTIVMEIFAFVINQF